ncbi:platelet-activating factor acetylhydrolase [Limtongia smithiae]|uniref:platelet-activating factor acetylhydrolase n=1 Tax=Limtongia smithiae TaxID=1125753 RepID=UPI0034CE44D4
MGLLTPTLPPYPGPFAVGTVELEVPCPVPKAFPEIDSSVDTLLFRVFYPGVAPADGAGMHPHWFPDDRRTYLKNYITFLGYRASVASLLSRVPYITDALIPAWENIPLLPPPQTVPDASSAATPPPPKKWPVVIFSHGLGGTRNAYSQFCGSIASHGHIVVALEHREHSAPLTYVRNFGAKPGEPTRREVKFVRMMLVNEVARRLRTYQLVHRVHEVVSVVKVLLDDNIELHPEVPFDWAQVDTRKEKVIYAGHSFGAATAVATVKGVYNLLELLHQHKTAPPPSNQTGQEEVPSDYKLDAVDRANEYLRAQPAAALLLLDVWCLPIYETMAIPLTVPAVGIMSETFYAWKPQMNLVYQLLSNSCVPTEQQPKTPLSRALFLAKPSVHHSQSDFGLLFPTVTRYAFKLSDCTYETQAAVMSMNVSGCTEFLKTLGFTEYDVSEEHEGLVRTQSREEVPSQPDKVLSKGYVVAGGKQQGWLKLEIKDDITVVDILSD